MSGATWQGRKGATPTWVAESARPDSKARPVTVERLRAVLGLPEMTDTDANNWLDRLFLLGDVTVEAFKERQSRASESLAVAEPLAVSHHSLTGTAFAAQ